MMSEALIYGLPLPKEAGNRPLSGIEDSRPLR